MARKSLQKVLITVVVSALASINKVNQRRTRLVLQVGDRIRVQFPVRDIYLGM